ncbi:unnamed protein product [Sphacelaria rigidula]
MPYTVTVRPLDGSDTAFESFSRSFSGSSSEVTDSTAIISHSAFPAHSIATTHCDPATTNPPEINAHSSEVDRSVELISTDQLVVCLVPNILNFGFWTHGSLSFEKYVCSC